MNRPSSNQSIILNSVLFVEMKQKQGVKPTQKEVREHLQTIYNQNPLMFGTSTWVSVAGTFRSMISKAKNNTDSNRGLEKYIKVKDKKGINVLSLKKKKQPSKVRWGIKTTNNKVKPIKKQNTMKNYRSDIFKALKESDKMKLHSDFEKNIEIISSYSTLVQYIKLIDITIDLFDDYYRKTNDVEIKELRNTLVSQRITNFSKYSENGDVNPLKPIIEGLIYFLSLF